MAGERLAMLFKQARGNEQDFTDILFGVVTKAKPLTINVENRFEIEESFLVLSKTVQKYTVTIDNPVEESKKIEIPIFRDLQVGDKVSMIRAQKGQLYYVLDRS